MVKSYCYSSSLISILQCHYLNTGFNHLRLQTIDASCTYCDTEFFVKWFDEQNIQEQIYEIGVSVDNKFIFIDRIQ